MRTLMFLSSALLQLALAGWAYNEDYKTKAAIAEVENLQREIGAKAKRLAVLKAEWAYLNRPDRLRALADMNFDELGLLPFEPGQFAKVKDVVKPIPDFDIFPQVIETASVSEGVQ